MWGRLPSQTSSYDSTPTNSLRNSALVLIAILIIAKSWNHFNRLATQTYGGTLTPKLRGIEKAICEIRMPTMNKIQDQFYSTKFTFHFLSHHIMLQKRNNIRNKNTHFGNTSFALLIFLHIKSQFLFPNFIKPLSYFPPVHRRENANTDASLNTAEQRATIREWGEGEKRETRKGRGEGRVTGPGVVTMMYGAGVRKSEEKRGKGREGRIEEL